jgi:hypothetical protein
MKLLKLLIIAFLPISAFAASPEFTSIDEDDMTVITKAMGSNFIHNSMMGASKMGTLFGFQVGVVGAQTGTSDLNTLVKENSGAELKNLYNAGIMGAVGIPFGIALEAVIMPTYKSNSASMSSTSFGLKWNINDVIPVLPVNLALRGITSSAELSFNQTISSSVAKVTNTTNVSGVQLLLSPMFPVVEPYVGIGLLSAKNKLDVSSGTIFTNTTLTEMSKTVSGTQILAGVEVNLLLLKLGLEYSNAFDNSRIGFKLGFGF